ncbi:YfhO family protein [uncultured Draconibacterium sp.]|uniref:YfhO family protein n=1 Tax=uncultured Draconibacterium sp. TaxID=1573823 RepID=UPI0029C7A251|nr:YfhO family protein [uncultured Draconibacterium sp.]
MNIDHFIKKYGSILLLAVCIIAFWQVAFLQNGMKWDFVDAYLPARYFFSEAVLNNIFPFWNPYLLYGVPCYADLVSVFSPEFWLVANMFGYSNITLQYVFLAYVFFAGVNFRYFLQRFNVNEPIALSLAIAYMLSGFTVGNAQHIGFIAGYALLPLVVAAYVEYARQPETKSLVRFALVYLVMVFAGYPGITIILSYLLLCLFCYYFVLSFRKSVKRFFVSHLILAGIILVGSFVLLLAYSQAQPYLSRYSGLTLETVLRHPFSLRSFWSFLFPYSTTTDVAFFNTDPSMSNAYFGLFGLALLVYALTGKIKQKAGVIFLLFAVFSLLTAMGSRFFLREFLYDHIPLMNMFKYPSIFRALTIFGFLAYAGLNCKIDDITSANKKKLLAVISVLAIIILFVVVRSVGQLEASVLFDFNLSLADRLQKTTIHEAFVLQGIIHLLLLGCFFIVLVLKQKYLPIAIVFLFAFDAIVSIQLNLHYTVVSDIDSIEFKADLDSQPKGFPIPELRPIGENTDKNASGKFTWRNNNVFPKRPTFDGLVSFKSDGYSTLSDDFPEVLDVMKMQPLFFFSDDVRANGDTANIGPKTVLLEPSDLQNINGKKQQQHQANKLEIESFSPNKIVVHTETLHEQLLVFQQNYFSGWKVTIDGKEQKIVRANYALMGTIVPAGEHVVQFSYGNKLIIVLFVVAMLLMLVLAGLLLFIHWKEDLKHRRMILGSAFGLVLLFIAFSGINRWRYHKKTSRLLPEIAEEFEALKNYDVTTFLSYASGTLVEMPNTDHQIYLDGNMNVAAFGKVLAETHTLQFALAWVNGAISKEVLELFSSYFPQVEKERISGNSGFILARKGDDEMSDFDEDFETGTNRVWEIDKTRIKIDSVTANAYYTFLPDQRWGAVLNITVDGTNSDLEKITVLGDLRFPEVFSEVNMVITVSRGKDQQEYYTRVISDFTYETGVWSRFAVVKMIDFDLQSGDVIHIYLWNRTEARFDIDNLRLKMCSGN